MAPKDKSAASCPNRLYLIYSVVGRMDKTTGLEPDTGIDSYVYSPLTHPSAFRVLRLQAGSDQDKVSFTLEQRIVEDVGDYEALSYTWGDTTEKRPTICCNMSFLVTQNLSCALHHLRYVDRERVLWIDAVCINQGSIPERDQQVSMMGDIYKSAQQVVIWLGEDRERGDTVAVVDRVLHKLSAIERDEWMNRYSVPDYEDSLGDERFWGSLEFLFGLPWFRRVWVLQEAALASSATFVLGQQTLPWKNLGFAVITKKRRAFRGWASKRDIMLGFVMFFRQCGATDPRDNIFALGGIIGNANTSDAIRADYNANYEVVLLNVVTACLLKQNPLDILSYVTTPAKATQRGLPSWVPLWGPHNGRHPFHVAETPFKASGHSNLGMAMSDSRDVLRISGRVIGIVNQVGEGPNPSTAALQAGESLRFDMDDLLDPRRDWLIKSWELASNILPYHTLEDDIDVFWRTLCCDMMPSGEEASNEYRESFLYYWETHIGLNRSNPDLSKFGMFDGASLM